MMLISAQGVAVGTGPTAELPPLTFAFGTELPGVVAVETDQRPTVLSLVVSGRMRPTAGRVLVDGHDDPRTLRRSIALVDTPTVADPAADLNLATVVREELVLAHRRAGSDLVTDVLRDLAAADYADVPIRLLPGAVRTRVLAELAARRTGVTGLVITSPERHGTPPAELAAILTDLRDRGLAVLTVTTAATRAALLEGARP